LSSKDQRGVRGNKSAEAAAALKRRGIYHGKHQTQTNAPPVPNMKDVGSAAYRRLMKKKGGDE
jgi:hypothetical protein